MKRIFVTLVNKDPQKDIEVTMKGFNLPASLNAAALRGHSADDFNDFGDEHVVPETITLRQKNGKISIPAHSVTFIELEK